MSRPSPQGRSWLEMNWLVHGILDRHLAERAARHARGRLLDVGCGEKPYRALFAPHVAAHVGLDHPKTQHARDAIDVFGAAEVIPILARSCDTILCAAVLEHLAEPARAVSEMYRVLRPGGIVILTAPLFWHLHESPQDFFRYTKFGLQYLFEKAGFEIQEILPLSGFVVTFGQELVYFLHQTWLGRRLRPVATLLGSLIQSVAFILGKIDPTQDFTWMYLVVARKA